jgi:hypothetical protein
MACPCCSPPCCTCTGPFYFYVNGKLLEAADAALNLPFSGRSIPGIGIEGDVGTVYANLGKASDVQCDGDGKFFARITIAQSGHVQFEEFRPVGDGQTEADYVEGTVSEARYYKFTLPPGGCGIITGEWIAFPDEANIEEYWSVGGNTLRYFERVAGAVNDSSELHIAWGDAVVHASCNVLCSGTGTGYGLPLEPASCEGVLDCQGSDCGCQQMESSPPGSYDIFGVAHFHCLLNPLP